MKLYLVHTTADDKVLFRWVGTQADAATQRAAYANQGIKRGDIHTKQVDVPTDKAGLLDFLNRGQFDD